MWDREYDLKVVFIFTKTNYFHREMPYVGCVTTAPCSAM